MQVHMSTCVCPFCITICVVQKIGQHVTKLGQCDTGLVVDRDTAVGFLCCTSFLISELCAASLSVAVDAVC